MQLQKQFKIRCSGIGQIMTEPQTKSPMDKYLDKKGQIEKGRADLKALEDANKITLKSYATLKEKVSTWEAELPELERNKDKIHLSKTCLSFVHKWIKEQPEFYGRSKNFKSKYTDKGNLCEAQSIEFASRYYGWGIAEKNEERKSNEYLEGECDVELAKTIEDIKNSWSQDTFPLFDNEIPIDGYGWQLQGYMELWDKEEAGLIYTLMDAPEFMVEREAWSRARDLGLDDLEAELYDEVKKEMTYSNFRDEIRIKRFFLKRDKALIASVYDRVKLIRKYIETL